ncbi:MAG: aspartate aminotransferase family protein [Armatimonadota bacterium]|nr:aspartate aminotransferase family protein [Armatimonadota bacterium]
MVPFPENPEAFTETIAELTERYLNPGLAKVLRFAGLGVEWYAEGAYIWDAQGRKFLDFLGGYGMFALGHRHPKVVEAVKRQLDLMPMPSKIMFNAPQAKLAEKLAQLLPGAIECTFFCNSGAEAVEGAIKLARKATGRVKIISTIGSYHGKTLGSLSASGREVYRKPFEPLLPGFVHVPYGDADAVAAHLDEHTAAVIVEPIQGEGGIRVPPDDYLPRLRELCDRYNAVLIVDEVQTGLGRTGKLWGVEHSGVQPDVVTLAKSLGGGVMPIGSFSATPKLWEEMFGENPLLHTSTFGGNELACAAGLAALEVIEQEGLVENARHIGAKLLHGLRQVQAEYPDFIQEVRGRGLMIGVEFHEADYGELTITNMIQRGVIAAYTLNNPKVIRMEPPLIITERDAEFALQVFAESVAVARELVQAVLA